MRLLQEYFQMKGGILQGKDGKGNKVIYIDPEVSENTYNLRNEIKAKFNALWLNSLKTWGWFVNNSNPQLIIDRYVKPCLEFLTQQETRPKADDSGNAVQRNFDDEMTNIMNALEKAIEVTKAVPAIDEETQQRLENFRKRLDDLFTKRDAEGNEKLKEFVTALIKFRNEVRKRNTYQYESILNIASIYVNAVMKGKSSEVRPKKQWLKMGYEINDGAEGIPMVGKRPAKTRPYTKEEKEKYIAWYLDKLGVSSVDELEPSAQYDLFERRLKRGKAVGTQISQYFFLTYSKSDVTAGENAEMSVQEPTENWWWDNKPADEKDKALVAALAEFAQSEECGKITVNLDANRDELDGARGNASNVGHINVVNDGNMRFPTFVHELTHELRHWAFASRNNPKLKKFYNRDADRDVREQEADLCAAFVTEKYGYDIQSRLNYVTNWGLNANNFSTVLDQIAEVATFIDDGIQKHMQKNNGIENNQEEL